MKVLLLRRIEKYPDRELYTFNLLLDGFIVNGFVYSRATHAILAPSVVRAGRKIRFVRAFGKTWLRLRELLEIELAQIPSDQVPNTGELMPGVPDEAVATPL